MYIFVYLFMYVYVCMEYHQSYIYIWVYRGFIWALDIYHIFRYIFRYRQRVQPTHEFQAQQSLHTYILVARFWSLGSLVLLSTQSSTSENGAATVRFLPDKARSPSAPSVSQGVPWGCPKVGSLNWSWGSIMRFYEVLWDFGSFWAGFSMLDNAMCSYKKCEPGCALCDASLWWHTTAAASNMRNMAMDNCPVTVAP